MAITSTGNLISSLTPGTVNQIHYTGTAYKYIFNMNSFSKTDLAVSRYNYLQSNINTSFDIDLACENTDGAVSDTLNAVLGVHDGKTPPTWVTVEETTGMMTVDTPNLKEDTNYTFYVKVKSSGDEEDQFFKLITLQVIATPEEPLETEPEGRLTM